VTRLQIILLASALALGGVLVLLDAPDGALLAIGLGLVLVGADWLVEGAARIARRLGISSFILGLSVVAFGTSAPELAAGIRAAIDGESDLVTGNVVGSNIANICLILGLTAVLRPVPCQTQLIRKDVPIMIGVTILGMVFMWTGASVSRPEGVVLSVGLALYTGMLVLIGRGERQALTELLEHQLEELVGSDAERRGSLWRPALMALGGAVALALGSSLLVDGAVGVAARIGVANSVIGLSLVAFGTSVPELVTSLAAAWRRESDLAVGNILGSNCFNILSVLGVSALVAPLATGPDMMNRDMWLMLAVSLACLPIMGSWGRITRSEGGVLLAVYVLYMIMIFATRAGPA